MNIIQRIVVILLLPVGLLTTGCKPKEKFDPAAGTPPASQVERAPDSTHVKVDKPELFPLVTAEEFIAVPELKATGAVNPDVSRAVPVISLASGRVLEIKARLGDTVTKGQLMMRVQSADISQAFSDYQQAVADLTLARAQLDRQKILYEHGAIAQKDLEVAVDTEVKARVMVETTLRKLKILGADVDHPSALVDIVAPISGIVTDQQVTAAAGVQSLSSPNPFTISDLSTVWVICDVYENNLPDVHLGENAAIRANAFPDRVIHGKISNIGPIMDPNIRTAKVRLEVANPGFLRLGMFVTALFRGSKTERRASVPAPAVLHLHDRDWVYLPEGAGRFRRVEVQGGQMLPNNRQEIVSGVAAGDQVVANALVLQNTVEQ